MRGKPSLDILDDSGDEQGQRTSGDEFVCVGAGGGGGADGHPIHLKPLPNMVRPADQHTPAN